MLVVLFIVGFTFFHNYSSNDTIAWQGPWILLITATSLNLLLSPIFAFFEGINKVKDVACIRMATQITSLFCIWSVLIFGGKLYTASVASLINFIINLILLFNYKNLISSLKSLFDVPVNSKIQYFKEIFPFQWRIALSWMSGYFIFQLFNPVLFAFSGAEAAGHMGMTLTVLTP